jgi:L-asparaginase type II
MPRRYVRSAIILILLAGLRLTGSGAELPKVLVIATGGTIAGEQSEPGTLGPYEIRKSVSEIVALVPDIRKYAQVETEQFLNIASSSITPDNWIQLARRINQLLVLRKDLAGIVVTHGTDRLEETGFFLHLTVKSTKPVVVVGAQRPPTGISPDGPLNLLSAIRVAGTPESVGKGVLVVMDQRILSARDTEKRYARSGGFSAVEMGMLGIVAAQGVQFFYTPARKHTSMSEFDVDSIKALPAVEIRYSYAGSDGGPRTEAKGIVVVTTGFTPSERTFYETQQKRGVIVATTFPSGDQVGSPVSSRENAPTIAVERMLPTHARILLMLALTRTQDPREIQRMFDQY